MSNRILEARRPVSDSTESERRDAWEEFKRLDAEGKRPTHFCGYRVTPYNERGDVMTTSLEWDDFKRLAQNPPAKGIIPSAHNGSRTNAYRNDEDWAEPYDVWLDHLLNGDPERAKRIRRIRTPEVHAMRPGWVRRWDDEEGEFDDLRYFDGLENHFEDRRREGTRTRPGGHAVRVAVEISQWCDTTAKASENRCGAVAAVCKALELSGLSVSLDMIRASPYNRQGKGWLQVVHNVPLAPNSLAIIANAGTHRRGFFALNEWAGNHVMKAHDMENYGRYTEATLNAYLETQDYDVVVAGDYTEVNTLYATVEDAEERALEIIEEFVNERQKAIR